MGKFVCRTKALIGLRGIMLWLGVAARDVFNSHPSRAASPCMMDNTVPQGTTKLGGGGRDARPLPSQIKLAARLVNGLWQAYTPINV
jgi:hypothetical protein